MRRSDVFVVCVGYVLCERGLAHVMMLRSAREARACEHGRDLGAFKAHATLTKPPWTHYTVITHKSTHDIRAVTSLLPMSSEGSNLL